MGTTLTGTTPQDTYDSLIKVTDNGPLSSTGKYLSDGLGNDSVLALSTSRVGIGVAAPTHLVQIYAASLPELRLGDASAQIQMYTNTTDGVLGMVGASPLIFRTNATERVRISSDGNVGIGTGSPVAKLQTTGTDAASVITGIALENFIATNPSSGNGVAVDFRLNNSGNTSAVTGKISTVNTFFRSNTDMVFSTFTSDALTEKVRIQSGGGISFNGDTAAANALDDYEEGTFTPTVVYSTSGAPTYAVQLGRYTKIGRTVQVQIYLSFNENGAVGNVSLGGLPFTSVNSTSRAITSVFSFGLTGVTSSVMGFVNSNATTVALFLNDNAATVLSSTYTDSDQDIYVTVTYEAA
jgi:hypothetical protein